MADFLYRLKQMHHRVHPAIQELARQQGIEFLEGPQGRVLSYLQEHEQEDIFIKDIEQEFKISKSVTSNLIKRMEKNGFIRVERSARDKRSKRIYLSETARQHAEQIPVFIEELHRRLLEGVEKSDLDTFLKVIEQIYQNAEKMEKGEIDV